MKRAKDKITAMLNAITFAEAGELDTAQELLETPPESVEVLESIHSRQEPDAEQDISLFDTVEAHMAAVAFAEAGEFQAAGDFIKAGNKSRAVLLVIEGRDPDEAAFSYAMGLCKRMDAHMDILLVVRKSANPGNEEISPSLRAAIQGRLAPLVRELELATVPFSLIICRGDMREKLYEFALRHKDIRMVVYDSPKAREDSAVSRGWHRMIETISRRLSIPLVVVSAKQPLEEYV